MSKDNYMRKHNDIKSEQLGMSIGTASHHLRKSIIFNFCKKLNLDICYQCNNKIENIEEFSIEHKIPYLHSSNPKELFFDLENIAFSHLKCNCGAARSNEHVNRKSISGFKGVMIPNDRHTKYRVSIKGKKYGAYNTAKEAALEYDRIAIEMFGNKALTNKKLNLL